MVLTEALAELKTLKKRMEKKEAFIRQYLVRQEQFKDPLASDGGSADVLKREMQSLRDLQDRFVKIRLAIQKTNEKEMITVAGQTYCVAEWLIWKRDVAPLQSRFLATLSQAVQQARAAAQKQGFTIATDGSASKPTDVIINVDERQMSIDAEFLEAVLGDLDGLLSLKNAVTIVEGV
jgi:hypothetical protein